MEKYKILQRCFGYSRFRPGQEELIDGILQGRDVFGIMPTGGGKSICYQVPALLLPGITLVISPLISLMHDQVLSLISVGIPAAYINSSLNSSQVQAVYRNERSCHRHHPHRRACLHDLLCHRQHHVKDHCRHAGLHALQHERNRRIVLKQRIKHRNDR